MIPSQVYNVRNLERAWRWLLTNPEALYKNYFRQAYRAYALTLAENLRDLSDRLRLNAYQPRHSAKVYLPKPSGVLRPLSLLTVEDQIVYQAFANVIAEKLGRRVGHRYEQQVFGHLYAGKGSFTFYRDWRRGFKKYSDAIRAAYVKDLVYTASFDLTACYDSIDHAVLKHFLTKLGLSENFADALCSLFVRWSSASHSTPIYHGHGIPQGPLASGLMAECVLQHLDGITITKQECYCRYVDDIRLLAKTEAALRKRLVALDRASKEVGLFPQSSKINIHKITDINEEVKSISNPPEPGSPGHPADQDEIHKRLEVLTARGQVQDATRFKFVLGQAIPRAKLSYRLLRLAERQPHLVLPVCNYLMKSDALPQGVSKECIRILKTQDLHPACTAAMLRVLSGRVHSSHAGQHATQCRKYLKRGDPELRAAAASALLSSGNMTWAQTKYHVLQSKNWLIRSSLIGQVDRDLIGDPSYEWLMNELLRDPIQDVAILAAERLLASGLEPRPPVREIHRSAQFILKAGGTIGNVSRAALVANAAAAVLAPRASSINWRTVLGRHYRPAMSKFARWRGYVETDPTAWVNLTDTINDLLIDSIFSHEAGAIGSYVLGDVGSVLDRRGRFARKYPLFFEAAQTTHRLRLESELSHAFNRSTRRATRRIKFNELKPLKRKLLEGYLEIWRGW